MQWALFLVGDSTDEIIASFPPSITNRPTEGMRIVAEGLLGENEEFLVYRWSLPSESSKPITPTNQTLPSFYKPITAQSSTNAPSITSSKPSITQSVPAITPAPVSGAVIELDSRPAGGTLSNQAGITSNEGSMTSNQPAITSNELHCEVCGTGPFKSLLELQGHKATAHPVKKVVRRKKTVGTLTGSTPSVPTASTVTPFTVSNPIPLTASPEQATQEREPTQAYSTLRRVRLIAPWSSCIQ